MKFTQPKAQVFVPDGLSFEAALARTTHMGVSAHQDDLEIMAVEGILDCYQQPDRWFTGVVLTDGRGSARTGQYAAYTDDEMQQVRIGEQNKAAFVGGYSAQVQLDFPSLAVKDRANHAPILDLVELFKTAHPQLVYTHNLADKHPTHVGTALKVIEALRRLPAADRPQRVLGCEVWRNLDWMQDEDKVVFDCTPKESLQAALLGVYDSQISGGKRYDLAAMGRRRANATYFASHAVDTATGLAFAMDLTPLVLDERLDIVAYVQTFIDRFTADVISRLK